MSQDEKELEEQATEMLQQDAKKNGTTLYREGIIDDRRRSVINRREVPLSKFEKRNKHD